MSEFLSFDARGDVVMTMPPAEMVRARSIGDETFLVEFGRLTADVDLGWMLAVHAAFTRALVEAGYAEDADNAVRRLMQAGGVS